MSTVMNTAQAHKREHHHQAVCYKCSYVGLEAASSHHCPLCGFLLIAEIQDVRPLQSVTVHDVLDRSRVEKVGAPALPGMGPTAAELEARRQRSCGAHLALALPRAGTGTTALEPPRSHRVLSLALAGALLAGLVAAVLVNGGI